MKNFKNTFLAMIVVLISLPIMGAEASYQPMEVDAQSYLMKLPGDLQREIIKIVATSSSAKEAIDSLRALTGVNKRYHSLINDENITNSIITLLADKWFERNRVQAAWNMQTAGAKNWFTTQKAKEWFKENQAQFADSLRRAFGTFIFSSSNMYADPNDVRKDRIKALLLLQLGFNPNVPREGTQELFVALKNNDMELFNALLHAGANPNTRNEQKYSDKEPILEKAILTRNLPAVESLLQAGANPNIISMDGPMMEVVAERVGQDPYWSVVLKKLQDAQAKRTQ